MTSAAQRILLDSADVNRTIARIAHQIIEKTALDDIGDRHVMLLGIPTRGPVLAKRFAARIAEYSGIEIPTGFLDITLYRDDLRAQPHRPLERTAVPAGGIDNAHVILVDDVLYSGRTVRAALDGLRDLGRPAIVQLAVLVDRGHRELPIRADYVGKNLPTARDEDVAVHFTETDGIDEVVLGPRGPAVGGSV
ncbi:MULTISPECIES: bifunctional pyr operon transcriptional regulator/uracil phosphoribosyltransferase PyrR [Gordonia]|uniref:bifunctional pyr operon transcriptional regulator/uracil phosphoribosyltransferase PyrR n=1 Tax=Gordonia TaxID=2053 RepID=UPI0025BF991E|nr:bifunctional pyr operon transcriptional regulator/uracil phosphoribosyltransferase PyrR [Gordonia sp. UBA5067]